MVTNEAHHLQSEHSHRHWVSIATRLWNLPTAAPSARLLLHPPRSPDGHFRLHSGAEAETQLGPHCLGGSPHTDVTGVLGGPWGMSHTCFKEQC